MILQGDSLDKLKELEDNIRNKIKVSENGCWEWCGSTNGVGYGEIRINYKKKYVHRVIYERLVGVIPEGKQIDHLCRNRICCNPEHLEVVSPKENVNRGDAAKPKPYMIKQYCSNGHLYSENTYIRPDGRGRNCVECVRIRSREYQRKRSRIL